MTDPRSRTLSVFAALLLGILIYSGIDPFDRMTWALEVFPAAAALALMIATHHRYPLTTLLYACIFVHCLVLIVGGVYTYARVPLGFEIAELFNLTRNPYDKIGHFFQGFVPALVAREVLIRGEFVNGRRMLNFLIVCVVLAISAFYELIEWWVALLAGQGADDGDGDIRIWRHGRSFRLVRRLGVESDSILPRWGGIPPRSPGGFGDSVSGRTAGVE